MKLSDFLAVLERFFLDIIGTVIPGAVFLIFGWVILGKPLILGSISPIPKNIYGWLSISLAGYILGHAIISIGERIVLPFIEFMQKRRIIGRLFRGLAVSQSELNDQISNSASFSEFAERSKKLYPYYRSNKRINEWRNLAMSIDQDSNQIVYRFMFISLFNLGIAVAAWALILTWLLLRGLSHIGISWFGTPIPINYGILLLMFIVSLPFLERRRHFYGMSWRVPFSMAVVKLSQMGKEKEKKIMPGVSSDSKPVVYLAGGFHSGWQDKVLSTIDFLDFFDPRTHGLKDKIQYTTWDLEAIRRSDWVFAYIEAENPGLYALSVEVGYAKALGKHILLVDEKSSSDPKAGRYLGMVQSVADIPFDSFDEALDYIKSLKGIYRNKDIVRK